MAHAAEIINFPSEQVMSGKHVSGMPVELIALLGGMELKVYAALCSFADGENKCHPKRKHIAERIYSDWGDIDESTQKNRVARISKVLTSLKSGGYIEIEGDGRFGKPNDYTLIHRVTKGDSKAHSKGVEKAHPHGDKKTHPHDVEKAHPQTTHHNNTPVQQSSGRAKRSTAIKSDFSISSEMREWAKTEGIQFDIDREHKSFVDYWLSNGKAKKDWVATWRNWMRRAQQTPNRPFYTNFNQGGSHGQDNHNSNSSQQYNKRVRTEGITQSAADAQAAVESWTRNDGSIGGDVDGTR